MRVRLNKYFYCPSVNPQRDYSHTRNILERIPLLMLLIEKNWFDLPYLFLPTTKIF